MDPRITAIICTRNRAALAEKCLKSVLQQSLDSHKYEVVIIDNASTDNTREVLKPYLDPERVFYFHEPEVGLSKARNTGWRNARGKYVGYIDDDAIAGYKWLAAALWCFENITPIPEWVGGPIELDWQVPAPEWINDSMRVTLGKVSWGSKMGWLNFDQRLGGGNSFFLRSRLEELGGFDDRLGRKHELLLSGEEDHLRKRLEAAGGRLYYHPDVMILHNVPEERTKPSWFYRRFYWGGVSDHIIQSLTGGRCQTKARSSKDEVFPTGSRWGRLLNNCRHALGIFSTSTNTIRSRANLSYYLGRIIATTKNFGRK